MPENEYLASVTKSNDLVYVSEKYDFKVKNDHRSKFPA